MPEKTRGWPPAKGIPPERRRVRGRRSSDEEEEVARTWESTLEGWIRAVDLRDGETEGHSRRVVDLSVRLAAELGLEGEALVHVRRGALLHDVGKMALPDSVLLKTEELTAGEQELMRKHPEYAWRMLNGIGFLRPALEIPLCHHERWDGTGYPQGLRAEQIPFAARLFAVVDVWDALRYDRAYKTAWPAERVREHLRAGAGSQFDPEVVPAFLRVLGRGEAASAPHAG